MISVSQAEYVTIYKFRKTVQIPIPARNAWGEESYTTAPEPPLNRPHHRQRRRPHRPPQDTDEEGMRTAGESDAEPGGSIVCWDHCFVDQRNQLPINSDLWLQILQLGLLSMKLFFSEAGNFTKSTWIDMLIMEIDKITLQLKAVLFCYFFTFLLVFSPKF